MDLGRSCCNRKKWEDQRFHGDQVVKMPKVQPKSQTEDFLTLILVAPMLILDTFEIFSAVLDSMTEKLLHCVVHILSEDAIQMQVDIGDHGRTLKPPSPMNIFVFY